MASCRLRASNKSLKPTPPAFGPPGRLSSTVGPTEGWLQVLEEAVVCSVRADPEPSDLVIVQKPKGAVSQGHASSVDRVAIVNLLELEARVAGVLAEQLIRLPSCFLDLRWEPAIRRPKTRRRTRIHSLSGSSSGALPAARSARASAASLLRAPCEAANWRAHASSSPSSSSSHRAITG